MNKTNLCKSTRRAFAATTIAASAALLAGGAWADYPLLDSQGSTAMDESFFDRAANWTNATLQISIPPSDPEASSYDYLLQHNLRSPATAGLHIFHSHFFRVRDAKIQEALASGVGTNRFENDGLRFQNNGGVTVLDGRYADVTYEGTVLVTSTLGSKSSFSAGQSNGSKASILRLSGTLKSDTSDRHMQCGAGGLGARVVIEADATGFSGTLYPQNASGWVTFDCPVFNGTIVPWNGSAIGTERATTSTQIKALSVNNAGITLIVPISNDGNSAGRLTITNSFSSTGPIKVQLRGNLPNFGKFPILRLASTCTGDFDSSTIAFADDILVDDLRAPIAISTTAAATVKLAFKTEGDGSRTLYVERTGPTVIYMR